MSRHRHINSNYNITPQVPLPTALTPAPAAAPAVLPLKNLLSALIPSKSVSSVPFSMPALPIGEIFGGVSNTVRGLVLNDNWWVVLLIIFLFFPNISSKMFGGLFKD